MKLISKMLAIAHVKGIAQLYLPLTRVSRMELAILPLLPAAEIIAFGDTHFPSHRGSEVELVCSGSFV